MRRNAGQALWKLNLEGFKNGEEEKTQKQQSKSTEDTRVLGMLRDDELWQGWGESPSKLEP